MGTNEKTEILLTPERRWEELDRDIDLQETHKCFKENRKVVGIYGYPAQLWKELWMMEDMSKILMEVMNNIYETGHLPSGWKISLLHMIQKGEGNEGDAINYKGGSLLSTI